MKSKQSAFAKLAGPLALAIGAVAVFLAGLYFWQPHPRAGLGLMGLGAFSFGLAAGVFLALARDLIRSCRGRGPEWIDETARRIVDTLAAKSSGSFPPHADDRMFQDIDALSARYEALRISHGFSEADRIARIEFVTRILTEKDKKNEVEK